MNELTHLIYEQLLELYLADLELELLVEKLKNVGTGVPQTPSPNPWTQPRTPHDPYYYGPPWYVTCTTYTTTPTEA